MRLKIADGDLIIVGAIDQKSGEKMGKAINEWLKHRGVNDVEILISFGQGNDPQKITVLSVNDVFQDMVLDGKETKNK